MVELRREQLLGYSGIEKDQSYLVHMERLWKPMHINLQALADMLSVLLHPVFFYCY